MLELAKLYLTTEELDACQHQCMSLLKSDNENDAATVVSISHELMTVSSFVRPARSGMCHVYDGSYYSQTL